MPIEEIVVRARAVDVRPSAGVRPGDFRREAARAAGTREGAARVRKPPAFPKASPREIAAALSEKKQVAEKLARQKLIDEIVVKGKRVTRAVRFGPVFGFLSTGASIGAEMAREVSQQRLDEAFRVFQNIEPRPKDSPVQTIEPDPIPEIIVTGRRTPPPRLLPTAISPSLRNLGDPRLPGRGVEFPDVRPRLTQPEIAPPPLPTVKRPTIPNIVPLFTGAGPGPTGTRQPTTPISRRVPTPTPTTRAVPRSILLGVGQPRPTGSRPPGLTGFSTPLLTSTQPERVRARTCPPCKKKKEKERTKCYKQLVKQGRTSKQDKIFNLVQIDCQTRKEIPKKRK